LTRLKQRSSFQQSSIATSRENEDLSTPANDDVTSAPKTLTFGSGNYYKSDVALTRRVSLKLFPHHQCDPTGQTHLKRDGDDGTQRNDKRHEHASARWWPREANKENSKGKEKTQG